MVLVLRRVFKCWTCCCEYEVNAFVAMKYYGGWDWGTCLCLSFFQNCRQPDESCCHRKQYSYVTAHHFKSMGHLAIFDRNLGDRRDS